MKKSRIVLAVFCCATLLGVAGCGEPDGGIDGAGSVNPAEQTDRTDSADSGGSDTYSDEFCAKAVEIDKNSERMESEMADLDWANKSEVVEYMSAASKEYAGLFRDLEQLAPAGSKKILGELAASNEDALERYEKIFAGEADESILTQAPTLSSGYLAELDKEITSINAACKTELPTDASPSGQ